MQEYAYMEIVLDPLTLSIALSSASHQRWNFIVQTER